MLKNKKNEFWANNSNQNTKESESSIASEKENNETTINCGVNVSNVEKKFIITDDQIRSLYVEFTKANPYSEKLIKVAKSAELWDEFENAKDDYYCRDEEFKREYEHLNDSCGEDEFVIYDYIPFSFQELLESVKNKIDIYCKENEDNFTCGIDEELNNLFLLRDIIEQNIPYSDLNLQSRY